MIKLIKGTAALVLTLLAVLATAQNSTLTEDKVSQYLESLREMESLAARMTESDREGAGDMAQLWLKGDTDAITEHLKTMNYYPKMQDAIEAAGFDSTAQWVNVAQRVTQAFMALEMRGQGVQMADQVRQGLEQIRQSDQLTDQQKQALTEQLQASQSHLSRIEDVSQADREAVRPFVEELRQQFERSSEEAAGR